MAERAAEWGIYKERKQLPTLVEWFQIRRLTDRKRWTVPERFMKRTAAVAYGRNWGSAGLCLLILKGVIGYLFGQQSLRSHQEKITLALDSIRTMLGPAIPVYIEKLIETRRADLTRPDLARRFITTSEPREKLSLAFVLAPFGRVETDCLISRIDEIEDRDTVGLIDALRHNRQQSIEKLK